MSCDNFQVLCVGMVITTLFNLIWIGEVEDPLVVPSQAFYVSLIIKFISLVSKN